MAMHCTKCGKSLRTPAEFCRNCQADLDKEVRAERRAEEERDWVSAEEFAEEQAKVAGRKMLFLTALASNGGHVERACKAAEVSRTTIARYQDDDPVFASAWEAIQDMNVENLEAEADRRATGYEKPLAYQGRLTGDVITEYSDNLLMFRLKALRPEKYRDSSASKTANAMSEEELNDALSKMMAKRAKKTKLPDDILDADTVN